MDELEVKSYKKLSLGKTNPKNAVIYVLDQITKEVKAYITDKNGIPRELQSNEIDIRDYVNVTNDAGYIEDNKLFIKRYVEGEGIRIEENQGEYKVSVTTTGGFEVVSNKQNSLHRDGSGEKYPTVDAVNEVISDLRTEIQNTTGDKNFVYTQIYPSEVWEFDHPLKKMPTPVVLDTANTVMLAQVTINDGTRIRIEFNYPVNGKVILN